MEIWLQQQASAVLTALAHAQELYGAGARAPRPFAPPPAAGSRPSRRSAVKPA